MPPRVNKQRKYKTGIKIALSAAILVFSAEAAVVFRAGTEWGLIGRFNILGFMLASAIFAVLLFVANYAHVGLLCAAGVVAAAVWTRDLTAVLWSAAYIPVGWLIFHGVRKKAGRTLITVRTAVFLGIFFAALAAGALIHGHGGISPEIFLRAVESEIDILVENVRNVMIDAAETPDADANTETVYLYFDYMAMNLTMMIPTLFVVYCLNIAYLSTAAFRVIYNLLLAARPGRISTRKAIGHEEWRVKLSAVSAVIMIICSVLYLLIDRHSLLASVIVSNIRFILTPGFCIMGIYFLYDKIHERYNRYRYAPNDSRLGPSLILFFACGLALMLFQNTAFAALTVFGLYSALIGDVKKLYDKTRKLVFGDDDGGDEDDEI